MRAKHLLFSPLLGAAELLTRQPLSELFLIALLPVLIEEIRRLKELHALAGVTELPVKDEKLLEEVAGLRKDIAKLFEHGAAAATTYRDNPVAVRPNPF